MNSALFALPTIARLCVALLIATSVMAAPNPPDRNRLLKGVETIAAPGMPGNVCVFGPDAIVLADGPTGRKGGSRIPVAGAAKVGKGLVIAFGHDGYLKSESLALGHTAILIENAIKLGALDHTNPRAVAVQIKGLAGALKARGIDLTEVNAARWREALDLARFQAILLPPSLPANDDDAAAVRKYLERGGTVFIAVTGWGWQMGHSGQSLEADLPANRMLIPMGLAIGSATSGSDGKDRLIQISKPIAPTLHVGAAIELLAQTAGKPANPPQLLKGKTDPDLDQASATVLQACADLPASAEPIARLRALTAAPGMALPTFTKPLRNHETLARIALVLSTRQAMAAPVDQIKAHLSAAEFPGAVPEAAARVERTLSINTSTPRWHSTGLYAAPGESIAVTLPESAAKKGLKVRIGSHTDKTYHLTAWRRAPEISRAFVISAVVTRAANAFGGMIYIESPARSELGTIEVKIAGAVEAPLFILGQTSVAEWREKIRHRPAPWAEIGSDKLIITLKSEAIRSLDDPTAVCEHWNRVLDETADLAGWDKQRKSPERMVSDADISAGYMHSGYPIMTGLDVTHAFVDLKTLRSVSGGWGFYHELGHNHQHPDWTFEGTTEVTVNLFSMHTLEKVCGATKEESTRRAVGDQAKIKKYLAAPDFEKWKADPFLALAMYAELRMEFGWEPFKKVIGEYRTLEPTQRPKTEIEKRDQWMTRMSKATGKNLGPFFEAWGVPTSDAARKGLEGLANWMPARR